MCQHTEWTGHENFGDVAASSFEFQNWLNSFGVDSRFEFQTVVCEFQE